MMKVLIIGYGSIGQRHEDVLLKFQNISRVDIVTKQTLQNKKTFLTLEVVDNLASYDYFIISSETSKHYEQLKYLERHLEYKTILCEKPLFDRSQNLVIQKNRVYVGYTLRFHALMQKLKKLIKNEVVLSVNASCGQYLPTWKPERDYRELYSADKSMGGGVLLDLSHEIDYVQWLFGELKEIKSYQKKISDLEIDSDDFTTFIGITNKNVIVNVTIDYISKITHREVHINTLEHSYSVDFIQATMTRTDKKGESEEYAVQNIETNHRYEMMHNSILNAEDICCDYEQARRVMKSIQTIKDQV